MPARPGSASGSGTARAKMTVRSKVAAAAAAPAAAGGGGSGSGSAAGTPAGVGECRNSTLTWLDLSSNNLGGYGLDPLPGAKLVRSLMEHPALAYLDLSRNRFSRSIVTSLVAGLEVNKSLTHLLLDCNGIDAVPAARMADVLAGHPRLTHLSLRLNSVRSDGATAFARMLAARPHGPLTHIDLRDNYIGPVGTIAILAAMGVDVPAAARALIEPPRVRCVVVAAWFAIIVMHPALHQPTHPPTYPCRTARRYPRRAASTLTSRWTAAHWGRARCWLGLVLPRCWRCAVVQVARRRRQRRRHRRRPRRR